MYTNTRLCTPGFHTTGGWPSGVLGLIKIHERDRWAHINAKLLHYQVCAGQSQAEPHWQCASNGKMDDTVNIGNRLWI